jgi:DNA-binding MarR family transcriptional regulator
VTADQFVVLAALAQGEASMQRELVTRTSSDPNTLRAMLVLLERVGLVERRPHPSDARARSVSLTPKGRLVLRSLWKKSHSVRRELLAGISPKEAEDLVRLLRTISRQFEGRSGPSRRVASSDTASSSF